MIRAKDAIDTGRKLIGTPYSEMDCIGLIVQIIRRSPGGVKMYRCQGTNWLWDSVNGSGQYRHLLERREGIDGARAGMLAFKRYGQDNEGHVGLVTDAGTVIHASSEGGSVMETPLTKAQGWDLLGIHRDIEAEEGMKEMSRLYRARVVTKEEPLSLREAPVNGRVIAKMPIGSIVDVLSDGDWPMVEYDGMSGYAARRYLEEIRDENSGMRMVLTDGEGNTWIPEGGFSVEMRMTED